MKKWLLFLFIALLKVSALLAQSKDRMPPVKAPFSKIDTLAINDWWNRKTTAIVNLKVERSEVVAFGLYTLYKHSFQLENILRFFVFLKTKPDKNI